MKFSLLNLLSLVTIVALTIALLSVIFVIDPVLTVKSKDGLYSWNLRQKLLEASPVWPESDPNPPLALRDAIEIADSIVPNLNAASQPLQIGNWELESLVISPLDNSYGESRSKWCYVAHFHGTRLPDHSGPAEQVAIMILMDGTIYVGAGAWANGQLEDAVREIYLGRGK